ncbi:hypothetical protein [Paenibacillus jiagnxiensis]|uniref:hypothetical protein n=1 Tax=Paenibacillus jiagnxiensis TaxID=3228926 RepID=UPI0033AFEFA8
MDTTPGSVRIDATPSSLDGEIGKNGGLLFIAARIEDHLFITRTYVRDIQLSQGYDILVWIRQAYERACSTMIKVVEILPGKDPVVKDIPSLRGQYGEEVFGERRDHARIGEDLYLAVGDSSALTGQAINFTIVYRAAQINVYGPAVFVNRVWETGEETFDEYKSLSAAEAAVIVDLFRRNRDVFEPMSLHKLLGWEL